MSSYASSRRREQSAKRNQTADSLLSIHRKKPSNISPTTSRLSHTTNLHRHNKLYRCPSTPPPSVQLGRERSFILDCTAVSNISNDYFTVNPKLGSVIPPYNAQLDPHVKKYFQFFGVSKVLKRSGQLTADESIAGRVQDRFYTHGHGHSYLSLRNKSGSGHSIDEIRGHQLFLSCPTSVVNYNGLFGYRRNTPSTNHR